jgi:hypothetical protein
MIINDLAIGIFQLVAVIVCFNKCGEAPKRLILSREEVHHIWAKVQRKY